MLSELLRHTGPDQSIVLDSCYRCEATPALTIAVEKRWRGHRTRRRVLAPWSAIATTHQTRSDTRPAQNFPRARIHCHPQVLWLRQTLAALDLSNASMTNPNSGHLRYLRARAGELEQRRLQAWQAAQVEQLARKQEQDAEVENNSPAVCPACRRGVLPTAAKCRCGAIVDADSSWKPVPR